MHVIDRSSGYGEDARPKAKSLYLLSISHVLLKGRGHGGRVHTIVFAGHVLTGKFGPGFSCPGGRRGLGGGRARPPSFGPRRCTTGGSLSTKIIGSSSISERIMVVKCGN